MGVTQGYIRVLKGLNKVLGYDPPIWENPTDEMVENCMETGNFIL